MDRYRRTAGDQAVFFALACEAARQLEPIPGAWSFGLSRLRDVVHDDHRGQFEPNMYGYHLARIDPSGSLADAFFGRVDMDNQEIERFKRGRQVAQTYALDLRNFQGRNTSFSTRTAPHFRGIADAMVCRTRYSPRRGGFSGIFMDATDRVSLLRFEFAPPFESCAFRFDLGPARFLIVGDYVNHLEEHVFLIVPPVPEYRKYFEAAETPSDPPPEELSPKEISHG